jgi:peptide/nickel transport system substrate-binding protein
MAMIMAFDQAKPESAVYDEATVPVFESFIAAFRGWRIVSEDPFVLEYYTDAYDLDAENNITNFRAAHFSAYQNGDAPWDALALGLRVEANEGAAFSSAKADALQVEQMSYISGPTLELLKAELDAAQAENYIPYEPTLGQFITADEATERYTNLQEWFRRRGHFFVATGPFYLEKAFPVEGTLILQRVENFPDLATKWDRFAEAPVPEVMVDGPGSVDIGSEAVFDVFVDFKGEPYAIADIDQVKFLVFDATGELVKVGEATAVEDGYWQVVLDADLTGALEAGSNKLAAIVVSKRALVPITETLEFVTK